MAGSSSPDAAAILQALQIALDVTGADKDKRKSATDFLEQVKHGEVHSVANVAFLLVQANQPLEVRHYAFTLLQHVAHVRWPEVPDAERRPLVTLFLQLLASVGRPEEAWALKSQAAALVAEVIRQEGPTLWQELLDPLATMAQQGPAAAETVAMLLRWLPEDVTVHNEDLNAPARRALVLGLTASLARVLPLLYSLASQHMGAAMAAVQAGQQAEAQPHAAVVTAVLAAADAYADWAPMPALDSSRLIEAAGALLQAREFRDGAADFLKHVAARRRPSDDTVEQHTVAVHHVTAALVGVAPSALSGATSSEDERQFAEKVGEGLAALGSMNAAAVAEQGQDATAAYLAQVLAYLSSPVLAVALPILPGVTSLLRDAGSLRDKQPKAKPGPILALPPDWCGAVLEAAHAKVHRSGSHGLILGDGGEGAQQEEHEDWPPEFDSARDYGAHRSRLGDVLRLVAAVHPRVAVEYACRQVMTATAAAVQSQPQGSKQLLLEVDACHVLLEAVLAGAPHSCLEAAAREEGQAAQDEAGLATPLDSMLHHLLSLQASTAGLVHLQGRLFDACGPYLACAPAALPACVHKLLLMLQTLQLPQGARAFDPSGPGLSTPREKAPIYAARLQVCTSVMRVARSAGAGLGPQLEGIAGAVAQMHTAGQLTPSEHNSLAEALLLIATAAGPEKQAQVLDWLLAPIRQQWMDAAWQQAVSTPAGLAALLCPPLPPAANGHLAPADRGPPSYWWIHHALALFEKALRRAAPLPSPGLPGVRVPHSPSAPTPAPARSSPPPVAPHPLRPHLGWILPPLLLLLRALHHLWLPHVQHTLPATLQAALRLGPSEVGVLLGSVGRSAADAQQTAPPPEEEQGPRSWLKGVRETGYALLGTAAARVPGFYEEAQRAAAVGGALAADLAAMELRHLRLLLKSAVSPLVSHCPPSQRDAWLGGLVPPVLLAAHARLPEAWRQAATQSSGAVQEMLHDKMTRDLTREVCALLALFTPSKPDPFASSPPPPVDPGLLGWLLQYPAAAAAGLELATQALSWPDTEAAQKALILAAGAAQLAPSEPRLHDLVGRTLLSVVVSALAQDSKAPLQADLLALVRDIYVGLAPRTPAVKQVLLSLPHMTAAALASLDACLGGSSSVREQRGAVRQLLQGGTGGQLRALQPQRGGTPITNLTDRGKQIQERAQAKQTGHKSTGLDREGDPIGLASLQ